MPLQQSLPLTSLRNRDLFSTHWLEKRLPLEPEWNDLRDEARSVLVALGDLWRTQKNRVEKYGNEQGLEEAFIQPVLRELGWKFKYQTFLQGREPDYALFLNDASFDSSLNAGRTNPDFWTYPTVVADAKSWHTSLDRPSVINNQREYPPQQIEWYLDRSRLDFGILTNGKLWRLTPREHDPQQRRFQTYLEFDLALLLDDWTSHPSLTDQLPLLDEFLYFYLFFSPAGFVQVAARQPLVRRAVEGSSEYRIGVSEGLKARAFEALRFCIEGFLTFSGNELDPGTDLAMVREQSFILLYRLLFIMYAEDRQLLPYGTNRPYTNNRSLRRHRDGIATRLDRVQEGRNSEYSREETAIWSDLIDLFDLVNRGHRTYGVPAYNGGLFDPDAHPFLAEKRISDNYLSRIIDRLGRAKDREHPGSGLFRVDYHDLVIQHLGAVYEGLLELQPHHATENMFVVSHRTSVREEERIVPLRAGIPEGFRATGEQIATGTIYLATEKGERRATGSYYTPDHIVSYIVENTLRPLCAEMSAQLDSEIKVAERKCDDSSAEEKQTLLENLERLRHDFDNRLLQLRVLDPAMGSGHFLLRACQYLAEEIATHPYTQETVAEESSLTYWKRQVVERCLYGVDMNPLAVELAKLALWLETVAADRPLTFLDHHLRCGNSLIGARLENLGALPGEVGLLRESFVRQAEDQMHVMLEPLAAIREAPSETATQVKEKERLHKGFERVRETFRLTADVWCSVACDPRSELTPAQYQATIDLITQPNKYRKLFDETWFGTAISFAGRPDVRCFHWELEFPEAFFEDHTRRSKGGFDAVVGNPPYDVLSEAESGRDLSSLRSFVETDAVYLPSRRGKNNLYKLFICRALELLVDGGRFGFITPMAVLGDDQSADIRRELLAVGGFTGIEAFPQKDNPSERVFPEAKLSTAIFTVVKSQSRSVKSLPFVSRVHPGRTIEMNSPSLILTTDSIPLYDPSNFTVVSCAQADWDLATRIISSGRMARLKQFVEFFQGEVNETNERSRGNLTTDPNVGKLVTRGASICLYVARPASQGEDLFLDVERFLRNKGPETKAFHHRERRIALQESSPQNNFRRIIAAFVPAGEFCNHTINYCPAPKSLLDLRFLLALLNTKLSDWYFRLGSTNAHVSHYQIYNLPCPVFASFESLENQAMARDALERVASCEADRILRILQPALEETPFSLAIQKTIIAAVDRIIAIEESRGDISRTARSALDPEAQPYQDLIDRLFYAMAGLSELEAAGLESRLAGML